LLTRRSHKRLAPFKGLNDYPHHFALCPKLDKVSERPDCSMFSRNVLKVDPVEAAKKITDAVEEQVLGVLKRRGVVVGLSGGIDSSVVAALCVRALGKERVFGLMMPERDSSPDSLRLARELADRLGINTEVEDIAPALEGLGCYRRQEEAIREVFPDFHTGQKFKITLPSLLDGNRLNVFRLTVETEQGSTSSSRMPAAAYLKIVAATNFKQRTRKMMEYYHADRLGYAVAGTPNRLEYDQGFFVKQGDGAADFKPIAHLYKTQVYELAAQLGVPEEICQRPPTTDTYSMAQTQEEFYFALPYAEMDLCLYAHDHSVDPEQVATVVGITPEQVKMVYRDIEAKRRTTRYLHQAPLLIEASS
jgi:NAD+ synthase